ncbi:MAG: hypothetical protein VYA86_06065 [Candidatus Thermoplasmatota archaeon]|nr:hypothetical protein [Candidatus Thermoplasmatota archaeon]
MDSVETVSQLLCASTLMLWVLIATFSRTDKSENRAQWGMVILALCTMLSLIILDFQNGSMWGSEYLPKPLAVLCLAFAFMARLNIKGRNISQGMNPHQIMKQNRDSDGET